MEKHYNLYYLFAQERQSFPMPEGRFRQIRKKLKKFFEKIKPP